MTAVKPATLGQFIQDYIREHSLTNHTFADLLNKVDPNPNSKWSYGTVSKYSHYGLKETYANKPIGYPEFGFLVVLANATNTDICTIVKLIAPKQIKDVTPKARLLSERIGSLPVELQELLDAAITGMIARQNYQGDDSQEISGL
jgi:hypothetical protein